MSKPSEAAKVSYYIAGIIAIIALALGLTYWAVHSIAVAVGLPQITWPLFVLACMMSSKGSSRR